MVVYSTLVLCLTVGMGGIREGLAWIPRAVVALGAIVLVIYLMWAGIPWLVGGVRGWWDWLGGHLWLTGASG